MWKRRANSRFSADLRAEAAVALRRTDLLALRTSPRVSAARRSASCATRTAWFGSVRMLPGERDCNFHLQPRTAPIRPEDPRSRGGIRDHRRQLSVLRHLADQDPSPAGPRVFPTVLVRRVAASSVRTASDSPPSSSVSCLVDCLRKCPRKRRLLGNVGDTLHGSITPCRDFFIPALGQRLAWDVRRLPELAGTCNTSMRHRCEATSEVVAAVGSDAMLGGLRSQAIHAIPWQNLLWIRRRVCQRHPGFGRHDPCAANRRAAAVTMSECSPRTSRRCDGRLRARGLRAQATLDARRDRVLYDRSRARHALTVLVHAWRSRHDPSGARVARSLLLDCRAIAAHALEIGRPSLTRQWHAAAGTRTSWAVQRVG